MSRSSTCSQREEREGRAGVGGLAITHAICLYVATQAWPSGNMPGRLDATLSERRRRDAGNRRTYARRIDVLSFGHASVTTKRPAEFVRLRCSAPTNLTPTRRPKPRRTTRTRSLQGRPYTYGDMDPGAFSVLENHRDNQMYINSLMNDDTQPGPLLTSSAMEFLNRQDGWSATSAAAGPVTWLPSNTQQRPASVERRRSPQPIVYQQYPLQQTEPLVQRAMPLQLVQAKPIPMAGEVVMVQQARPAEVVMMHQAPPPVQWVEEPMQMVEMVQPPHMQLIEAHAPPPPPPPLPPANAEQDLEELRQFELALRRDLRDDAMREQEEIRRQQQNEFSEHLARMQVRYPSLVFDSEVIAQ